MTPSLMLSFAASYEMKASFDLVNPVLKQQPLSTQTILPKTYILLITGQCRLQNAEKLAKLKIIKTLPSLRSRSAIPCVYDDFSRQ